MAWRGAGNTTGFAMQGVAEERASRCERAVFTDGVGYIVAGVVAASSVSAAERGASLTL